jgi:putative DNA primase/helicase
VVPCWWPLPDGSCACGDKKCDNVGKHPLGKLAKHGYKDATRDPVTIRRWWEAYPQANIGIATGARSGFWVLDVDGEKSLELFVENQGMPLPRCPQQITGGGRHLLFAHNGEPIRNRASDIAPGLDTRADGGLIIAAPSLHYSGRRYAWDPENDLDEVPLPTAPDWLVRLASGKSRKQRAHQDRERVFAPGPEWQDVPPDAVCAGGLEYRLDMETGRQQARRPSGSNGAYGQKALDEECANVRSAPEGARNDTLNRATFSLGQLVASGHLDQAEVERALKAAALDAGLEPAEIDKTIASGLAAGMQHPRIDRPAAAAAQTLIDQPIGTFLEDTDVANARRLVTIGQGKIVFARGIGWLGWTGTYWAEGDREVVKLATSLSSVILREAADAPSQSEERDRLTKWAKKTEAKERIKAAIELARPHVEIPLADLDANVWLLNVQNGTIDLRTSQLLPHNPADLITKIAPVTFDPEATCPKWDAFLARVLPHSPLRDYAQRFCGYCLTGSVEEQVFHFLYGGGSNGKTTFLDILKRVLGPYVATAPADLLTAAQGERHATELMTVRGARLVICAEPEEGRHWATERLKLLTGEESISARRMRQDFVQFANTAKLAVMANHRPAVRSHSDAFWRRMRVLPFVVTIPKAERLPKFKDHLATEASGILNWILDGLAAWRHHGLGSSPEVETAVQNYRASTDNVLLFIQEFCELGPSFSVQPGALHTAYCSWCGASGEAPAHAKAFKNRLVDQGFERKIIRGFNLLEGHQIGE